MESMKSSAFVSVVIPLYNKQYAISDTIKSVLKQSYSNFELIIVDDGSTDDSAKIVKQFEDSRIRFYKKQNGGASSARNYGAKCAKGEWIAFLDADDTYYPGALENFMEVILNHNDVDVVSANFVLSSTNRSAWVKQYHGYVPKGKEYKWMFFKRYDVGNGRSIIKSEIIKNNPFINSLHRYEDLEAILRWIKKARIYLITDYNSLLVHNEFNELSKPLQNTEFDYGFNLNFKERTFWEKCVLGDLLYETFRSYKVNAYSLIQKHIHNIHYCLIAVLYHVCWKILR